MQITNLQLQAFRNHLQASWSFPTPVTIIVGQNGSGKTSILEALHVTATGSSFRADTVADMIGFDHELARIHSTWITSKHDAVSPNAESVENSEATKTELEVLLTRGEVQGKRTQSRLYSINGIRRLKKAFVGNALTVLFRPEDMRLMEGSPSRRREIWDTSLSMTHPEYAHALVTYEQVLKRRNKLLGDVREGIAPRQSLSYWNQQLVVYGQKLQNYRKNWVAHTAEVVFPIIMRAQYQPSIINESRLLEHLNREIAAGHTLIGPHKDDMSVLRNDRSLAAFGSRGQQRLGVLWLKLAEWQYVATTLHKKPVLLLDDIMSELDEQAQQFVISIMKQTQTIITTIDASTVTDIDKEIPNTTTIELSLQ